MGMTAEDRLAALEAKMQEMEDRQAILDCIRRTARGNDRFDHELIVDAYHDDGVHELGRNQIPGKGYADHANHAHGALFSANLHHITMHLCEIDGNVAHAESYNIGLFLSPDGQTGRVLSGRYLDRLEKRDGQWRIMLRRATVEVALEGPATLPNGNALPGSGYLKGSRDKGDPSYERPLSTESGERW